LRIDANWTRLGATKTSRNANNKGIKNRELFLNSARPAEPQNGRTQSDHTEDRRRSWFGNDWIVLGLEKEEEVKVRSAD
jgi:hypothetical protein